MDRILKDVILHYDEKTVIEDRKNHMFAEISKTFGCDFGITVCGEYDENNEFQMEYYFPYFRGTGITTQEDVVIEKHAGKESYAGACDDVRIGVTIIFYLQNAGEYLTERSHGNYSRGSYAITLRPWLRRERFFFLSQRMRNRKKKRRKIPSTATV